MPVEGETFEIPYPFIREEYNDFGEDGPFVRMTWRPGVRDEWIAPDDTEMVCDGMGHQIVTVVSEHKPGKFPMRVFYIRRWRDPNGHEFGKPKLRMTTAGAFKHLRKGYRHNFRVITETETKVA